MKKFGVAHFVNKDRLSSIFDKSFIDESVNLIKEADAEIKYKSINLQ